MLTQGPARRVTIYVTEGSTYHHQPVYMAVLSYLFYHGVSGATVTRGVAGFGADHHMHSTQFEVLSTNLPLKVEFIDSAERVESLLPKLYDMVASGLIEVQDTTIVKAPGTAETKPQPLPPAVLRGQAKVCIKGAVHERRRQIARVEVGQDDYAELLFRDHSHHRCSISLHHVLSVL